MRVAQIVRERVDNAPVLGATALLAEKMRQQLFFNKGNLKEHQNAAQNKKSDVPGSSCIKKILKFIESYYNIGELFMWYMHAAVLPKPKNIAVFVLITVG